MNQMVSIPIAEATPIAPENLDNRAKFHPDQALFDLVDKYVAAERKMRELLWKADKLEGKFRTKRDMPDVLRWRVSDRKLGLPPMYVCEAFGPRPNWDCEIQIRSIRPKRWITGETRFVGNRKPIVHMVTPSKAARRRADEIIRAFDEWSAEAPPPRGYKKLVKERDIAERLTVRLEDKIYETRATTMEGLLAKVRAGHSTLFCQPEEIDETDLDQISLCADRMADSIFRDIRQGLAVTSKA